MSYGMSSLEGYRRRWRLVGDIEGELARLSPRGAGKRVLAVSSAILEAVRNAIYGRRQYVHEEAAKWLVGQLVVGPSAVL